MNIAALPDGFYLSRHAVGLDCASMSASIEIKTANGQLTFASFIGEQPRRCGRTQAGELIGQAGAVDTVTSDGCHRAT